MVEAKSAFQQWMLLLPLLFLVDPQSLKQCQGWTVPRFFRLARRRGQSHEQKQPTPQRDIVWQYYGDDNNDKEQQQQRQLPPFTVSLSDIVQTTGSSRVHPRPLLETKDSSKNCKMVGVLYNDNHGNNHGNNHGDNDKATVLLEEEHVHNYFMGIAIQQAQRAAERGEVPVGAVVVRNYTTTTGTRTRTTRTASAPKESSDCRIDSEAKFVNTLRTSDESQTTNKVFVHFEVLSWGSNQVEETRDASAHAEMLALRRAAASEYMDNWRLYNTTLYTTLEPCPMCLAAAQAFRIDGIVYGAPDLRLGALFTHMNLLELAPHPFHNISYIVSNIRQDECAQLLRNFFRQQRQKRKQQRQQEQQQRTILETTSR